MKILNKEQEKEIEKIKEENNFLKRGYRAISSCLEYNSAIISILNKIGIREIEIDMKDYLREEHELEVERTHNNTFKIRVVPGRTKMLEVKDE